MGIRSKLGVEGKTPLRAIANLGATIKRATDILLPTSRESMSKDMRARYDEAKEASVAASMHSPYAYQLSKKRMHEIETQKALIIKVSRHDTWKTGGPN